ncbi:hypothetical protein K438DRAFT_1773125 [Mycena galopus ATCC 62051]|nr:hypothetical protein K438DRAFT_1773125 [Mycena galopus ATCC 62051]
MVITGAEPWRGAYAYDATASWYRKTGRRPAGPSKTRGLGRDVMAGAGVHPNSEDVDCHGWCWFGGVGLRASLGETSKMSSMGGTVMAVCTSARNTLDEWTLRRDWAAARTVCWAILRSPQATRTFYRRGSYSRVTFLEAMPRKAPSNESIAALEEWVPPIILGGVKEVRSVSNAKGSPERGGITARKFNDGYGSHDAPPSLVLIPLFGVLNYISREEAGVRQDSILGAKFGAKVSSAGFNCCASGRKA